MQSDRRDKKHFTKLVLHRKFGFCVIIVKAKQKEYVVFDLHDCNLEAFYQDCITDEKNMNHLIRNLLKRFSAVWIQSGTRRSFGLFWSYQTLGKKSLCLVSAAIQF